MSDEENMNHHFSVSCSMCGEWDSDSDDATVNELGHMVPPPGWAWSLGTCNFGTGKIWFLLCPGCTEEAKNPFYPQRAR